MNKCKCKQCRWQSICKDNNPKECESFRYSCNQCDSEAIVLYKNKPYCKECILKELDIETFTTTHYVCDGEYLGNDGDNDFDDIFGDFKGVEVIDE